MKAVLVRRGSLIGVFFYLLFLCVVLQGGAYADIDFFRSPEERISSMPDPSRDGSIGVKQATVLFFVSPACGSCPEEASKLQTELTRMGWKYEIEGIFVGNPTQVGKYLTELRTYPFKFELGLDMDGLIAKRYGVKTFPTAVIEVNGKRVVVTRASEMSEKLR